MNVKCIALNHVFNKHKKPFIDGSLTIFYLIILKYELKYIAMSTLKKYFVSEVFFSPIGINQPKYLGHISHIGDLLFGYNANCDEN